MVNVSLFFYILNHPSWRLIFTAGLKIFLGEVYYAWFILCVFEVISFSPKSKNILRSWLIYGANMLNHLIIRINQLNVTCFHYIWWWIRLLIHNYLVIFFWLHCPYNWDYYLFILSTLDRGYFYPNKLIWMLYVIALKYPRMEGDIVKAYKKWRS